MALPRAYEAKISARPELVPFLSSVKFFDTAVGALRVCEHVVIATPPQRQREVVAECLAFPGIQTLVLEKPVAITPDLADQVLEAIWSAGRSVRVGYSLLFTGWFQSVQWPAALAGIDRVTIDWAFLAHHFARDLYNWKRRHETGGGVLRFYGIHVIALLESMGYDKVVSSALRARSGDGPEQWNAEFAGAGLPPCRVQVMSRSLDKHFRIMRHTPDGTIAPVVDMADPFAGEVGRNGNDNRVETIGRLLSSRADADAAFESHYRRVNALWASVEASTAWEETR